MSWAWDKEKNWVPNRIQTYELPNTGRALYPLDLHRTHGEGGHKLYYRVYFQILPSFILSPKVPLFSNPKNIIPCSPQSESTVCISFTLPLFNEHYLINLSFAIRPISIHSIYAPIMSRQRHVIDDTLFSYVFCIQNIIKKQSAKPQPHCCTKIQDSHLPESETKSQRALWHTYPWCDL